MKASVPFGHWKTETFIAGLRHDGLVAPFVINCPMNRKMFEAYIETQLAPTLEPGDVVMGDVVLTPKLDRMFRSSLDALDNLNLFKGMGVSLHMLDLGGDVTGNGISKLVFTILSAVGYPSAGVSMMMEGWSRSPSSRPPSGRWSP